MKPLPTLAALLLLGAGGSASARAQEFGPPQSVPGSAKHVGAADFDFDGDLDLLATWHGGTYWSENLDGLGTFGPQQGIDPSNGTLTSVPADLNGDGAMDVLTVWGPGLGQFCDLWWLQNLGCGKFALAQSFSCDWGPVRSLFGADLDDDGDADILIATSPGTSQIAWYENLDGAGSFGPRRLIDQGPATVFPADLDDDGDVDLLAAELYAPGRVLWFEQVNPGVFSPEQLISTSSSGWTSVVAADVDGDDDLDALCASSGDSKIAWYKNLGGASSFGPQQVIEDEANGAAWLSASDLDDDGDPDLLASSAAGASWYENVGLGFAPAAPISSGGTASAVTADLDSDGDCDVLSGGSGFSWSENLTDRPGVCCGNCLLPVEPQPPDGDTDGSYDGCDNCPATANVDQANADQDALGDVCDNCVDAPNSSQVDTDQDAFGDACDNCLDVTNPDQANADQDAFGDVCDNCNGAPNFSYGIAGFETILALNTTDFCWDHPVDIVWVRGPLDGVGAYPIDFALFEPSATCVSSAEEPPPGQGDYFLVRAYCNSASWQSSLGAEPLRDVLLP